MKKRVSCLCLALLLLLSLVACDKQAEAQDSTPPTASAPLTVEPTPTPEPTPPIPFTDVPENSFYYDAVVWAYENSIASDGPTFEPTSTCSRAQAITFIWRAMGSPEPQITENPISDISSSDWYYKPALWAYETGVVTGDTFKPNGSCTNGEALTFLWRAEGKPMAAVNSSAAAMAASGAYYERPAAWADSNGLFTQMGTAFDPAAPCSRAYLMSYLYWAEEQWTSAEEIRALQAEYGEIISNAQPYEVFGYGLFYADYIDVEGDGQPELLTLGVDWEAFTATATVYANMDGHAGKCCEQVFGLAGAENWLGVYQADSQLYLGISRMYRYVGDEYEFFRVENGAFVCNDSVREEYDSDKDITRYIGIDGKDISEDEYRTTWKKYTKQKDLLYVGPAGFEFGECGILSVPGIEVNGTTVKLSADPYYSIMYDDLMVPLRDVLEAMGVAVYANSDASVILASTKSDTLAITYSDFFNYNFDDINSTYYGRDKTYKYSMNGGESQKIAIEFTNGKTFVPLQTIVSLFGTTAEWDGSAGAMQITSNIPDSNRISQDELKKMVNFDQEQAQQVAAKKGFERAFFSNNDGSTYGRFSFKNGKVIWTGYVEVSYIYEKDEYENIIGLTIEQYPIEVASDGTVTAYPNDREYRPSSQF